MIHVAIKQLSHAADLQLPSYETAGSAGMDVRAALGENSITLLPGERTLVPTGLAIALPEGFEAQIRPRSGLAIKQGITVLNSPGTIDTDYRGEIKVITINHGTEPFIINHGDRIAQIIIAPFSRITWDNSRELKDTSRGEGGFGSTGV